jgi:molybdenum cofactor guanylyltransferase
MVTASDVPFRRISSGSSAATVSGRVLRCGPRMRSTGVRLVTRPTGGRYPRERAYGVAVSELPPYTAVVLAGGRAARLGGQAKPQLEVGGRSMLAGVLGAVSDAECRIVVGPPQPVPGEVVVLREQPPGGGPVAALRAGLPAVRTDVVAVLAGDLPFLTPAVIAQLRGLLTGDGVLVVDDCGRDQLLLGVWRTDALRRVLAGPGGPSSMRRLLAPLTVARLLPVVPPGTPPPWLDCDTPADLARARAHAASAREATGTPSGPHLAPPTG